MANTDSLCGKCDGRCCKYVSLEIDEPEDGDGFDTLRWYVSHEGCSVYREEGKWYFEVMTKCEHLGAGNRCAIYAKRPDICREHGTDSCEMSTDDFAWDVRLETLKDVEDYARISLRNKKTRGVKTFVPPWDRRAKAHNARKGKKKR